jgi:hypothetical protein
MKEEFIKELLELSSQNRIYQIKSNYSKQFVISFIEKNIESFYNQDFLSQLIKIYLADENPGVYENSLNLVFNILGHQEYKEYILSSKFVENIIDFLQKIEENSILLIRVLEILLKFLNSYTSDFCVETLKKICSNFFNYDLLTQLTFLDTLEKIISKDSLVSLVLFEINFFQSLASGVIVSNQILRKMMYTLSKFYAQKLLGDKPLLKNLLAVSIQYYSDSKSETEFIIAILINCFHNIEIIDFMMNAENNTNFDFLNSTIDIIIEIYNSHDPKIKINALELLSVICDFSMPSMVRENFLKQFLRKFYYYEYDKFPEVENEIFKYLVDRLYKDFKTHDFEEYEFQFLDTILSTFLLNYRIYII